MLFIADGETLEILYSNKAIEQYFGKTGLGKCCFEQVCGGDPDERCPVKQLRKAGSFEIFSPILKKTITCQATEVKWKGKKAFLVNCYS
ncbi:MAG: hypothetical protein K2H23_02840, partial [Oscillospiraceae bacterium]|nr:hypothetical protein [Oscillospiraceae bacterium]